MKEAPEALNRIVDVVLAYHPTRKKKPKAARNKKLKSKQQRGAGRSHGR